MHAQIIPCELLSFSVVVEAVQLLPQRASHELTFRPSAYHAHARHVQVTILSRCSVLHPGMQVKAKVLALQRQLAQRWKLGGDCIRSSFDMHAAASLRSISAPICRQTKPTAWSTSCKRIILTSCCVCIRCLCHILQI